MGESDSANARHAIEPIPLGPVGELGGEQTLAPDFCTL
jgi:hypothetical protein